MDNMAFNPTTGTSHRSTERRYNIDPSIFKRDYTTYLLWIIVLLIGIIFVLVGVTVCAWNVFGELQQAVANMQTKSSKESAEFRSFSDLSGERLAEIEKTLQILQGDNNESCSS